MLVRSLFPTCHSLNPTGARKTQKAPLGAFCLAVNIAMISRINIGLGTPAPRPQPPVGNPIGHLVTKTLPPPVRHSPTVKTP